MIPSRRAPARRDESVVRRDHRPVGRDTSVGGRDNSKIARDRPIGGRDRRPVARDGQAVKRDKRIGGRDKRPVSKRRATSSHSTSPSDPSRLTCGGSVLKDVFIDRRMPEVAKETRA